jgi:hypothetical protein
MPKFIQIQGGTSVWLIFNRDNSCKMWLDRFFEEKSWRLFLAVDMAKF